MSDSIKSDSLQPISQVLSKHTDDWMQIPGVVGTGETMKNGKPAVMIFVDSLTDALRSKLPSSADGYPVVIKETGTIKAN